MRLLEHESKRLLRTQNLPVPRSTVIEKGVTASFKFPTVLKSQVPVGGRGKLGGIVIVDSANGIEEIIDQLFSLEIKGHKPTVLLAEEKLSIASEHYVCLLIDRASETIRLIAHRDGGMEVENNDTQDFFNVPIDELTLDEQSHQLAQYLGYKTNLIQPFIANLYNAFVKTDATLLEINPLVYTTGGVLICGDCKMELDDAASFRHLEWDFEDIPSDTNFVILDQKGTVATIANGAGLAMATVDAVATRGMKPANFLDIGGGANTESVLKAFRRIMEFPSIEAIVINIFAGITRCDEVAKAIIAAKKQIEHLPPLYIRLAGTNFEEAVALLAEQNIVTLATLEECLKAAEGSKS